MISVAAHRQSLVDIERELGLNLVILWPGKMKDQGKVRVYLLEYNREYNHIIQKALNEGRTQDSKKMDQTI